MKGSIIIVCFFILGTLFGYFHFIPDPVINSDVNFYALCILMFCVGINLGNDPKTWYNLKRISPLFLLLPVATIIGTLLGSATISLALGNRSAFESMAVGSGLGYYSLSSVFITEYKGAELGTIALLSNICREIIALLSAPVSMKYFGKLAPIAVGGATTMDTTLPIIIKYSGKEYVGISLFHGLITDISVPFLVTLFCQIN